jgi:hypothetical protein
VKRWGSTTPPAMLLPCDIPSCSKHPACCRAQSVAACDRRETQAQQASLRATVPSTIERIGGSSSSVIVTVRSKLGASRRPRPMERGVAHGSGDPAKRQRRELLPWLAAKVCLRRAFWRVLPSALALSAVAWLGLSKSPCPGRSPGASLRTRGQTPSQGATHRFHRYALLTPSRYTTRAQADQLNECSRRRPYSVRYVRHSGARGLPCRSS